MKLEELKSLHSHVKEILKNSEIQDVALHDTETALTKKFNVSELTFLPAFIETNLMKQSGMRDISTLPKTVESTYVAYKQSYYKLMSLSQQLEEAIKTHEKSGSKDDDGVNWSYFPIKVDSEDAKMSEIIRTYELLPRQYVDFKLACQNANKQQNFQGQIAFDTDKERYINLSSNDFSDEFIASACEPLQDIFEALSGKFDYDNVNKKLSSLRLNEIDKEFLYIDYGKDSYTTYFDNQSVHLPVRDLNTPAQNKKAEDFVNAYLKKSGLPETIKPNLKVFVTTLTNQGVFAQNMARVFSQFFSIQGATVMNFGSDYRIHLSFDEKNQLKVHVISAQNIYNISTGDILKIIDSNIKMEFTIAVNVVNNAPFFTLVDKSITCSFITPLENHMGIGKHALKDPKSVSSDKLDPFKNCIEYIAKFLGYNSVANLYRAKGKNLTSTEDKEEFGTTPFDTLVDLASQDSNHTNGKKLSAAEKKFLMRTYDAYKKGKISLNNISKEVCTFVNDQLANPNLSSTDRISYIYWLQFARELKGNENPKDEIHKIYESLVKQLINKDPNILCKAAEDDAELYQEIVHVTSSFFNTKLFTNEDHALRLAKYPFILQGNMREHFTKLVNNLKPEVKMLFLEKFITNGNDITSLAGLTKNFFNKDFVGSLKSGLVEKNDKVLDFMNILMTEAPAATTGYLREPLKEVFDVYCKKILEETPAVDLLEFLSSIKDDKLIERFGLKFLENFVNKLQQLACDPIEIGLAPAIATELAKMLNSEAELLIKSGGEHLLVDLNAVKLMVEHKFSDTSQKEKTSEVAQKGNDVSASSDKASYVFKKQKVNRSENKKEAKSIVEQLKEVKTKSVISLETLGEKSSVVQESGEKEAPLISHNKGLKH